MYSCLCICVCLCICSCICLCLHMSCMCRCFYLCFYICVRPLSANVPWGLAARRLWQSSNLSKVSSGIILYSCLKLFRCFLLCLKPLLEDLCPGVFVFVWRCETFIKIGRYKWRLLQEIIQRWFRRSLSRCAGNGAQLFISTFSSRLYRWWQDMVKIKILCQRHNKIPKLTTGWKTDVWWLITTLQPQLRNLKVQSGTVHHALHFLQVRYFSSKSLNHFLLNVATTVIDVDVKNIKCKLDM